MEFTETKKYCKTIDEAFTMLLFLPDTDFYDTLPDIEEIKAMVNRLIALYAKSVWFEIMSNDKPEEALPLYKDVCMQVMSITKYRNTPSFALIGIDGIVNRLKKENGLEQASIDLYISQCSKLQYHIFKQIERLQEVFAKIGEQEEPEPELPERAKKGFELAIQKGWLLQLPNGKYRWIAKIKGKGFMQGYFVGELFGIVYLKNEFPKWVDDLFEGTKPHKNFNNYWQHIEERKRQGGTIEKKPEWRTKADEVLKLLPK